MTHSRAAIILAAGKGKRMKSDLPKVLHEINGQPLIRILLDTLTPMSFDRLVVVVGYKGELVLKCLKDYPVEFSWQREQLGTGHAVMSTRELLGSFEGTTLVANGDVPFLSKGAIERLLKIHEKSASAATCLSAIFEDPTGYGRIVREGKTDRLMEIVEHKDASAEVLTINEINSGTFCFDNQHLFESLQSIDKDNTQAEYYLTDTIKVLHNKGLRVSVVPVENPDEVCGVNSVEQLRELGSKFFAH